jgi:hypothetical protein
MRKAASTKAILTAWGVGDSRVLPTVLVAELIFNENRLVGR